MNTYNKMCRIYKKGEKMDKYICKVCGYIYDPKENNDVAFEDLKEDWICPLCAAPKEEFSKIL